MVLLDKTLFNSTELKNHLLSSEKQHLPSNMVLDKGMARKYKGYKHFAIIPQVR